MINWGPQILPKEQIPLIVTNWNASSGTLKVFQEKLTNFSRKSGKADSYQELPDI